jgi:hypothetical protein
VTAKRTNIPNFGGRGRGRGRGGYRGGGRGYQGYSPYGRSRGRYVARCVRRIILLIGHTGDVDVAFECNDQLFDKSAEWTLLSAVHYATLHLCMCNMLLNLDAVSAFTAQVLNTMALIGTPFFKSRMIHP